MNKHILLTGGTGAIGSRLAAALTRRGYQLTILSHRKLEFDDEEKPQYVQADITDARALADALRVVSFDVVIHLAGVTHAHDNERYFEVNTEGTKNVLAACEEKTISRFIYISSRVAGEHAGAYARSKLFAEEAVRNSNFPWVIVRPSEVYGGDAREAISSLITIMKRWHVAPIIGSGEYRVAPVWVEDVVNAIVSSVERGHPRKTYTLCGPQEYTYTAMIDMIKNSLNTSVFKLHLPVSFFRILALVSRLCGSRIFVADQIERLISDKPTDITEAKRDLGYEPLSFDEGLHKLI